MATSIAGLDFSKALLIYTITKHPADFPDDYVLRRRWSFPQPQPAFVDERVIMKSHEIEVLRIYLRAMGMTCAGRFEDDAPIAVESWC